MKSSNPYQRPKFEMTGRNDRTRFYHIVKRLDLSRPESLRRIEPGVAVFIGLKSDIGTSRNQGITGAKDGPDAIRKVLGFMAFHGPKDLKIFDVGDVVPQGEDLESALDALADLVTDITKRGGLTIVLGGSHDLAAAQLRGLMRVFPNKPIPALNIDAHFDNRPLVDGLGHSGSWVTEIYEEHQKQNLDWPVMVYGKQWGRNTLELHERAKKLQYTAIDVADIQDNPARSLKIAEDFIAYQTGLNNPLYLSLCVDVIDQAHAPGVSSPSPFGLTPREVAQVAAKAATSKAIAGFGIAEVNPSKDRDNITTLSVAQIIEEVIRSLYQRD